MQLNSGTVAGNSDSIVFKRLTQENPFLFFFNWMCIYLSDDCLLCEYPIYDKLNFLLT